MGRRVLFEVCCLLLVGVSVGVDLSCEVHMVPGSSLDRAGRSVPISQSGVVQINLTMGRLTFMHSFGVVRLGRLISIIERRGRRVRGIEKILGGHGHASAVRQEAVESLGP